MTRTIIIRAPGTTGDLETAHAFQLAGAKSVEIVHLNRLFEQHKMLEQFDILCIPGGFSFGDDIGAGKIFAEKIKCSLYEPMRSFRDAGKLILGIGNGFQVLLQSGLLGKSDNMALTKNTLSDVTHRWVHLQTNPSKCVFLHGIESMYLPIAHTEGRFITQTPEDFVALHTKQQLPLCYVPSGDVAGVCDETGRVFGLMPHPERYIDPLQHPHWTRLDTSPPEGNGLVLFRNAVRYVRC